MMKICNKCKEEKSYSEYHKRGHGFQPRCKSCRSKASDVTKT